MKKEVLKLFKQIGAIAIVTFHELIREKILWSSFLFGILCVGLAYAVSQLSFVESARIALSFGLTAVSIVGGLISVVMGASLIAKEVQNRTLYLVLTKSVWRWQLVLGRYLGLCGVLVLNTACMIFILFVVFLFLGGSFQIQFLQCLLLQLIELGILSSIACIFSAFTTPTLAAVFTLGIWVIGHAMEGFQIVVKKAEISGLLNGVLNILIQVLPDLTRFDVKAQIAHTLPLTWLYTMHTVFYGVSYIVFALVLSCFIFSKRDL